jgi:hypothetical protein
MNRQIRDLRDGLLHFLKVNRFLSHFVGTDGDNRVDETHEEVFHQYEELGIFDLLHQIPGRAYPLGHPRVLLRQLMSWLQAR